MSDKIYLKEITLPIVETGENETYSFVQTDDDLETAGDAADAKAVGDELTNLKQDFNEYHPNLGSGYSTQLLSTVFIEDEVPYNFRTSGGSADIGDREYDEIVGVSMPINQLVQNPQTETKNGVTLTNNGDGSVTINGTNSGSSSAIFSMSSNRIIPSGHKVLLIGSPSMGGWNSFTIYDNSLGASAAVGSRGSIIYSSTGVAGQIAIAVWAGVSVNNVKVYPLNSDLTLLLGTAIADYVYGLEQSTAGSGVTWLKHHFPKIFDSGYIPYNAGEMQSVSGLSAHRMTGFNQWDEEWELGTYNPDTGAKDSSSTNIRTKNPVPVVPNTVYEIVCPTFGMFGHKVYFDKGMNFIGYAYSQRSDGKIRFTTPANAWYVCGWSGSGTTSYSGDVCMHLVWDGERDGQYEEYKEYEYALDDSVVLRGKLELDSNNNLRANGDRYLPDGTVGRRYGVVDLGTLTYVYEPEAKVGQFRVETVPLHSAGIYPTYTGNIVCSRYVAVSPKSFREFADMEVGWSNGAGDLTMLRIVDTRYTDAATFKTALSGVYLVYEKDTATTETAEPYQSPQIVDDWGTEEYVSTSLVPVGHDTKYANNLRAKLEMAPESPAGNGDYIVRQTNGENEYVALGSTTTIQGILDRLAALENA